MFKLVSTHQPCGDQPKAIQQICEHIEQGHKGVTLLGVTGSGKTFTMANVIAKLDRPALIIAPNKTLAAQLYEEMRQLFPENAVEYFVSYYDYYQPEAYLPASDTYIEKDSSINDEIDKLRHSATRSLLTRRDVVIVASVSCIYGLGSPEEYSNMIVKVQQGDSIRRNVFMQRLVGIRYEREDLDFKRGTFRVRGDTVEIFPAYEEFNALRVEFFGDEVDRVSIFDPLTGSIISKEKELVIYPASHYATSSEVTRKAIKSIQEELREHLNVLKNNMKIVEARRLESRTYLDIEMMEQIGYCKGIENYSRHLTGRAQGEPPPTLFEYFPTDFILFIDESHITVPQLGGMYKGDRSRKSTLVEHGFRLPSALDNRPLNFDEFQKMLKQVVFVSATPAAYELEYSQGTIVEQVIRPTGLVDPAVTIEPSKHQVEHLQNEIKKVVEKGERVLVTTLTKKMAEELTDFYADKGIKARYLHADISTLERLDIINELRRGTYDVLIGINLLREGLDLPEVSLVAILDADKEGFLRSARSLIQIIGRAARNVNGKVIMYADDITDSIKEAVAETERRRNIQLAYNMENNITPKTIIKNLSSPLADITRMDYVDDLQKDAESEKYNNIDEIDNAINKLTWDMKSFASQLEFEKAGQVRDKIKKLKKLRLELG